MLENVYEGLNARPKVYLSKEYFCEMYSTCVSSKLCGFIFSSFWCPNVRGGGVKPVGTKSQVNPKILSTGSP